MVGKVHDIGFVHNGFYLAWELDFWGKYRRATEAARANVLASEWGRRAVISTLVANVADAYFELRALDLELEISQQTLSSRQDSLKLTQALEQNGSVSLTLRTISSPVFTSLPTIALASVGWSVSWL